MFKANRVDLLSLESKQSLLSTGIRHGPEVHHYAASSAANFWEHYQQLGNSKQMQLINLYKNSHFSQDNNLVSHPLMLCALILHISGGTPTV